MLGLFNKKQHRIKITDSSIFIDNQKKSSGLPLEIEHVFKFTQAIPEIKIFENENLSRVFRIDTLAENPDLSAQFLHSSIRILSNSAVMIDGIVSRNTSVFAKWTEEGYEAIRLQPFYLSDKDEENIKLKGTGLFSRGLHFSGTITPRGVRNVCICDSCNASFTIQHFHARFSEVQYFYSTDSKETLVVPYNMIKELPQQLQDNIDPSVLEMLEAKLPKPICGSGAFRYYNSFKCPYCSEAFIDFEKNKWLRPGEYYGNTLINSSPLRAEV
jgi:hypothetical protein